MRVITHEVRPLGFSYPLEHRETAAGFASRLAAVNGRSLKNLLRDMAIYNRNLDKADEATVRKIAILGSADADRLLRYTPFEQGKQHYQVADEVLPRLSVNRTFFRFCPRCAVDDMARYDGVSHSRPWMRLEWTIAHFRSCERHRVQLTVTSPERIPFAPFDFNQTMRALLPDLNRHSDNAPEADRSPFQSWLRGRIDGCRSDDNWLDDLPLYVAAPFCEALGMSALHPPKFPISKLEACDWALAAETGYEIASGGEPAIRELLDRLTAAQSSTRGFWGLRDTYGYAYGVLQKTASDPAWEKPRNLFREVALKNVPIEPGTDVLGVTATHRKVHTVRTAARDSGMHALSIRRLFKRLGVEEAAERSGKLDHRILVEAESVNSLMAELRDAVTAPAVERMLGVPRMHLNDMVAHGHIKAVGNTDRKNGKRRFSIAEVERVRKLIFDGSVDVIDPTARQMDVSGVRKAATCTIPDVLQMIFSEQLSWKGRMQGRDDYGALLLDADEVTALIRSRGTRVHLTKEEARNFIPGTHDRVINKLIAQGHLDLIEEYSHDARRMLPVVSMESIAAFVADYVALGELCQRTGLHHKRVRATLKLAGILPELVPEAVGAFFYRREAVDGFEAANHDAWEYDQETALKALRKLKAANPSRSQRSVQTQPSGYG
ncbi:TniQ family protein [Aquibium carbonis]|uniref:TniQ family protein n=1 Tax=Aquibium carbonis TaxID=2495581 RepID=UPI0014781CA2|nr:TniQ family protein [Aquibium carbonis]